MIDDTLLDDLIVAIEDELTGAEVDYPAGMRAGHRITIDEFSMKQALQVVIADRLTERTGAGNDLYNDLRSVLVECMDAICADDDQALSDHDSGRADGIAMAIVRLDGMKQRFATSGIRAAPENNNLTNTLICETMGNRKLQLVATEKDDGAPTDNSTDADQSIPD